MTNVTPLNTEPQTAQEFLEKHPEIRTVRERIAVERAWDAAHRVGYDHGYTAGHDHGYAIGIVGPAGV